MFIKQVVYCYMMERVFLSQNIVSAEQIVCTHWLNNVGAAAPTVPMVPKPSVTAIYIINYVVSVRRLYVRPSVRVSWFKNANNSTTAGTRRTKFGTQVGWPGPVIVLKFQHTATDGAPSARARVRH